VNKIKLVLLFSLAGNLTYGQAPKNFRTMAHIYDEWLSRGACDTLYYMDKVDPEVVNATIKRIKSKKTFALNVEYTGSQKNALIITAAEQTYLISELNKIKTYKWPSGLFKRSKVISKNNIKGVFAVTHQYPKRKSNNCSIIYSFSKPIYLRNGNICFYLNQEQYSNNSTQLSYDFYIKVNNEWEIYADGYVNMGTDDGGENESSSVFMTETSVPPLLPVQNNTPPAQNISTPAQMQEFGKKVLAAFQTAAQSQKIDAFQNLFPTIEQRESMAKAMGITIHASTEDKQDNQKMQFTMFLYGCITVLEDAKTLNIDWSKTTFTDVKKIETNIPTRTGYKGPPVIIRGLDVLFRQGAQNYKINLEIVDFVDNEWRTSGQMKLSQL
jgi:hypothetical protein